MKTVAPVLLVFLCACANGSDNVPTHSECETDRDCEDSIACTADRCIPTVNGFLRCDNNPDDTLCPDGQLCMTDSLLGSGCQDPQKLACAGKPEGDSCLAQDACATSGGHCHSGACAFERLQCPEKPCLASEGCDRESGICRYTIAAEDTPCDADGDRCTDDQCAGGRCIQGSDTCECSDSRPCVQPSNLCLGLAECRDGQCVSTPVDCTPYNTQCLINYCVPATGLCEAMTINQGGVCADDLACTGPGTCVGGACVAGPVTCPEKVCNSAVCVEPDGCRYTPAPGVCDDGDLCNGPDACDEGECVPTGDGISCDDHNACTTDQCVPQSGLCRHVPIDGCCGNSILEAGEQCDSLNLPGTGCSSCEFSVVSLDYGGASPRFAWSPDLLAGLVTWEVVDEEGRHGVALRGLSSLAAFGETLAVPAGTVSGRSMAPVVAAAPEGFVVGALTRDAPEFWLVDASGRPRIRTAVRNPWNQGTPTGRLVMAHSELRSVAAWTVQQPGGNQQILYADIAVGISQLLVSGSALLFETEGVGEIIPGDACALADGVVVTFAVRTEDLSASVVTQKAAYFKAGSSAVTIFELAASEWDQSYPTACAPAADGGFLAVYTRLEKSPVGRIVVEGAFVDLADGPGVPFEIESISNDDGPQVMPFSSDLVVSGAGTFLFVCPIVAPKLSVPESVTPAVIGISSSGQVLSEPVLLDGPALDFAGGLAAGMTGDSTLSVFWVETSDIAMIYTGGQVAGRLFPAPGL